MTTAKLFNLKKSNPKHACDANRCTDNPTQTTIGDLWGLPDDVKLCDKHMAMALAFVEQNPDYEPPAEVVESTSLARSGPIEGIAIASTWLQRAQDVIGEIRDSLEKALVQLEMATNFSIENQEDFELVSGMAREVKTRRDRYEAFEKELTAPLNAVLKRIRQLIAEPKVTWEKVEGQLRGRMREAKLREAERNEELMQQAAERHERGENTADIVQQMTTSTDLDGVSLNIVWVGKVIDAKKLPDEYVVRTPDYKKLKEYAASFKGKEPDPIEGVRFEKDVTSRVQSVKN